MILLINNDIVCDSLYKCLVTVELGTIKTKKIKHYKFELRQLSL